MGKSSFRGSGGFGSRCRNALVGSSSFDCALHCRRCVVLGTTKLDMDRLMTVGLGSAMGTGEGVGRVLVYMIFFLLFEAEVQPFKSDMHTPISLC